MWFRGEIIQQHIVMHAVTQPLLHTHASPITHSHIASIHTAIGLMKIRWMLSERRAAVKLIAVCPLPLIMMGCILENLHRIDFIWKDYLSSVSLEGWCV